MNHDTLTLAILETLEARNTFSRLTPEERRAEYRWDSGNRWVPARSLHVYARRHGIEMVGYTDSKVRYRLGKLVKAGIVEVRDGGEYALIDDVRRDELRRERIVKTASRAGNQLRRAFRETSDACSAIAAAAGLLDCNSGEVLAKLQDVLEALGAIEAEVTASSHRAIDANS